MKDIRLYIRNLIKESFSNEKTITVYHGTKPNRLDSIKSGGLKSDVGYDSAGWYMVSTDFESALYHANAEPGQEAPVFEFSVPVTNEHWEGYPYFWPPTIIGSGAKWFALKQELPPDFIKKVHLVPYEKYLKQKEEKF